MPPFVGAAVNVTLAPLQIVVPAEEEMDTAGAAADVTFIVNVLDVAVGEEAHEALEVITQLTVFPLESVEVEYVGLFVPTFEPFTFHW